jgi:hypothetical protein
MKKTKISVGILLLPALLTFLSCEKENDLTQKNPLEDANSNLEIKARASFNKSKDILIAQFDGKPDADDIHSVAALGCMLKHPDLKDVNYFAVQGAYGNQGGKFIDATTLYNKVFGSKDTKWADANKNKSASVTKVKNLARTILDKGGKVWVQEAGQSNFTKLWVSGLQSDGVSKSIIKSNVIVVQHSKWNENHTNKADLTFVKTNTTYQAIDDGNKNPGTGPNRGPDTPNYNIGNTSFLKDAKKSRNAIAKDYWTTADKIIDASDFNAGFSVIPKGGVDFSDCVENIWIFDITSAGTVSKFWSRYVTN